MRSRSFVAVALTMLLLLAAAGAVLAYDSSRRDTIAQGITVGGISVGGLSVAQARARLHSAYRSRLSDPVVLRYGRKRFVLTPSAAHAQIDVDGAVQQALARSRADNLLVRVFRSLTGGSINVNIDPELSYSRAAARRFASGVDRALNRSAVDATVSYSGDSIGPVASRTGVMVRDGALSAAIQSALSGSGGQRAISVPVGVTAPKVSSSQLASRYPTIITIDRSAFTLRLWRHLQMVKSYEIAVGMAGLETPAGLYHIQDKEVNPSWHVPSSSWAGSLAGQTIPPGPADPIKARWMGIYNGAGIHGTDELGSLGSAASHGCIRMAIPDVVELYNETPLGTPVFIA